MKKAMEYGFSCAATLNAEGITYFMIHIRRKIPNGAPEMTRSTHGCLRTPALKFSLL